jgi:hypothetical protein
LRWLHGDLRHRIFVAQRRQVEGAEGLQQQWAHYCVSRGDLDHKFMVADSAWGRADDTYVMIHETRSWRVSDQINCLKAAVVDLDCHAPQDPPVDIVVKQSLDRLRIAGVALPQLVVHTGRGAQLIWRLERVGLQRDKTNAAKRWVLLQRQLAREAGPHADSSIVDLARLIRMPGTRNTKVDDPDWLTHSEFVDGAPASYPFDSLCDQLLPASRKVCNTNKRARGSAAKPEGSARQKSKEAGLIQVSQRRLEDYKKIADHFFMAGIPQGFRDKYLFCVAADLAWSTPLSDACRFEQIVLDRLMMLGSVVDQRTRSAYRGRVNEPLSLSEARSAIGSVVRRFKQAAAGQRMTFNDMPCDPRYWLSSNTVWEQLGKALEAREGLMESLQEVLPKKLRHAARMARREAAAERKPDLRLRSERYKKHQTTPDKRAQAAAAALSGRTRADVACEYGVTERTLYNWLTVQRAAPKAQDAARDQAEALEQAEPTVPALSPAAPSAATGPEPEVSPVPLYGVARVGGAGLPAVARNSVLSDTGGSTGPAAQAPPTDGDGVSVGVGVPGIAVEPVSPRRVAGSARGKVRDIGEARLARLRALPAALVLRRLANHAKKDRDYRPIKNPHSTRWHASVGDYDVELLCTGPRFWDTRAGCGGGGAVDLAMHLFNLDFKRAVALLKLRGIDGSLSAESIEAACGE